MRLRFRSISYTVGRTPASLERHYRELREAMLRAGQQYGLQPAMPWRPPIDIYETPEAIQIKIELAGVREEDIDVTLYDNALVVSGQRLNDVSPDDFVYYHEAQVRYGPFRADVLLPFPVEREAAAATYEHGYLRVRLPKAQPATIEARGGEGQRAQGAQNGSGEGGSDGEPRGQSSGQPGGRPESEDGTASGGAPDRIGEGAAPRRASTGAV